MMATFRNSGPNNSSYVAPGAVARCTHPKCSTSPKVVHVSILQTRCPAWTFPTSIEQFTHLWSHISSACLGCERKLTSSAVSWSMFSLLFRNNIVATSITQRLKNYITTTFIPLECLLVMCFCKVGITFFGVFFLMCLTHLCLWCWSCWSEVFQSGTESCVKQWFCRSHIYFF